MMVEAVRDRLSLGMPDGVALLLLWKVVLVLLLRDAEWGVDRAGVLLTMRTGGEVFIELLPRTLSFFELVFAAVAAADEKT